MAHAIVNKLLHEPTSRLRRAAELGVEAELADATARLFGFGETEIPPPQAGEARRGSDKLVAPPPQTSPLLRNGEGAAAEPKKDA
jgi:glutamyl-tRNA reductase